MDGVVGGDDEHEVVDVRLGVAACSTCTTLNVVSGNHTGVDCGVGVVLAFEVAGHKPCYNECNHWKDGEIPADAVQEPYYISENIHNTVCLFGFLTLFFFISLSF